MPFSIRTADKPYMGVPPEGVDSILFKIHSDEIVVGLTQASEYLP